MTSAAKSYLVSRIEGCRTEKQVQMQYKAIDQYAYSGTITREDVSILHKRCKKRIIDIQEKQ